ncbi:Glu/Leu/Phe/Val dehydrogenase dimerization domain-containing protein [Rufibacter latericius]|uniref:Glu/Leu/Phe/Val dehydrogenase n=1 Tax=Rufibacter latericius TaxID=2487040 RepID=A0A3M9MMT9_9BACT|nr:Glu/Leu/Phe/Val dehydrogenase dimerization domain-containing protein [Rufibacter latericius]RNI26854.1 Glu/Leu/Phe/Val dehydrogenase [Rufibacter latericius]
MIEVKDLTTEQETSVFSQISEYNHEQVVFCHDHDTGLKAIIGVHNTVLGPALGGTRMWTYATEAEALRDVLRLSRGMTFKSAISGLNLGGGKAVIIGDSKKDKTEAMMRKFGRFVNNLNGKYITAEDMGMTTQDMAYIGMETKYVAGLPESQGGSGDPSPVTAYGTYMGMKAAAKKAWGNDSLAGKKISVQGTGHVGGYLIDYLAKENAQLFITDIDQDRLKRISAATGATVVGLDEIYDVDVDIYSPCAMGATINDNTLSRLKCQVIAGCANNQLKNEDIHGPALVDMGIVYAPDFLINAGGIINVYSEVKKLNREWAMQQTEQIYNTTLNIFAKAEADGTHTQRAATEIAQKRVDDMAKIKQTY